MRLRLMQLASIVFQLNMKVNQTCRDHGLNQNGTLLRAWQGKDFQLSDGNAFLLIVSNYNENLSYKQPHAWNFYYNGISLCAIVQAKVECRILLQQKFQNLQTILCHMFVNYTVILFQTTITTNSIISWGYEIRSEWSKHYSNPKTCSDKYPSVCSSCWEPAAVIALTTENLFGLLWRLTDHWLSQKKQKQKLTTSNKLNESYIVLLAHVQWMDE